MRGNSFGNNLVLTTFGESHGPAMGAVIDGVPSGIVLGVEDFEKALLRRRPGQSDLTTQRNERDAPEILSGVFEGRTLGTPIAVIVRNTDARSKDYDPSLYRRGHADYAWEAKYGIRDYRGGGRASGRETLSRVIGGVVAEKILLASTRIVAFTSRIGEIEGQSIPDVLARATVDQHPTRCPDLEAAERMTNAILECKAAGDSLGGVIDLRIDGAEAGLGEPVYRKAKSLLVEAVMSIGAVAGVYLGEGYEEVFRKGSAFHVPADSEQPGSALRSSGIQGGITTGERIVLRVYVKPTSTIGEAALQGRHDPCIVPRIVPVVEAMAALVLADLTLGKRLDRTEYSPLH